MSKTHLRRLVAILTLFFMQSSMAESPEIFTVRGITYAPLYRAQENTLDAFLGIVQWNKDHPENKISGAEMHVVVIKPQNPAGAPIFVCSHDEDLFDLTGQKINIHNLSLQEIKSLQIQQTLDHVDYGRTRNFTFFPDILDIFMKDQPPFLIWLNVKDKNYFPLVGQNGYTSTELMKALKVWREWYLQNRHVDIFKYIIISSDNPFIAYEINKISMSEGFDKQGLDIFPDYFVMKLPPFIWKVIFAMGGLEKLLNMNSKWVSLEGPLITPELIDKYHKQGTKIIGWNVNNSSPYYNQLDAALVSY
jgi:glycerophosphoryl diester phosphodiesterase